MPFGHVVRTFVPGWTEYIGGDFGMISDGQYWTLIWICWYQGNFMNFCEVLLNMINYGYHGVDTASYRLLRFGEKLVQIWCSEDMEPGHNKSLVQWIQDRGLCMA